MRVRTEMSYALLADQIPDLVRIPSAKEHVRRPHRRHRPSETPTV